MPHECTNCGRVFADGSKEMLSGCPDCGGNKFQFKPASATDSTGETDSADASTTGAEDRELSPSAREWPDPGEAETDPDPPGISPTDRGSSGSDSRPTTTKGKTPEPAEDAAQASARTDVVSPDEIDSAPEGAATSGADPSASPARDDTAAPDPSADSDGRIADRPADDRPDLTELREELNEQFESIRIVAPGEYELNLMELYNRTEYIISLQEDGRYVIEVPNTWDTTPDSDGT